MTLPFFLGSVRFGMGGADETLDAFYERGGRDVDTARVYPGSEESIGAWERKRGVEGELRILTKGAHPAKDSDEPRLDAVSVNDDLSLSLDALGRDSVESFLLHRDDPQTPTSEIAATLAALVASGRVRTVGVSNWSADRVTALADELERLGGPTIAWVSNPYGLAEVGGVEPTGAAFRALAKARGFRILAWSALSNGFFTGGRGATNPRYLTPENERRRQVLEEVAAEHGVRAVDALARWTVIGSDVVVPVLGPSGLDHVNDLASATTDSSLDAAVGALMQRLPESAG